MRSGIVAGGFVGWALIAGLALAGCGASAGDEETTTPVAASELRPLEIGTPTAELRGIEGDRAAFEIRVVITNPNPVEVTMRRMDGELFLDGRQAARIEVVGDDPIDPDSEREIVFDVRVPVAMIASVQSDQYVARGTVRADAGSGDGALESPFELSGIVPRDR